MKSWDILILTLPQRQTKFEALKMELERQIRFSNATNAVNVRFFLDSGENSVGFKRNQLLQSSVADYICFVDDDDWIASDYISLLFEAIQKGPDCVSLIGLITTNGKNPKQFVHSIRYEHYFEENDIYFRPPNHLNVIKRSIACNFEFPLINHGEDTDWAMQVCRSGLLKKEVEIQSTIYLYRFEPQISLDDVEKPKFWKRFARKLNHLQKDIQKYTKN